jgi:hypothetical protein
LGTSSILAHTHTLTRFNSQRPIKICGKNFLCRRVRNTLGITHTRWTTKFYGNGNAKYKKKRRMSPRICIGESIICPTPENPSRAVAFLGMCIGQFHSLSPLGTSTRTQTLWNPKYIYFSGSTFCIRPTNNKKTSHFELSLSTNKSIGKRQSWELKCFCCKSLQKAVFKSWWGSKN